MTRVEHLSDDVQVWLGDARQIVPTLRDISAVVTSPPYGQQRDYGKKIDDWRALVSGVLAPVNDDGCTQVLVNLGMVHKDGEVIPYWDDLIDEMKAESWRLFGWYVWDQLSGMAGDWNGRLAPSFEFVFHFNRKARLVNKTKPTLGGKQHGANIKKADGSASLKSHDGRPVNTVKVPDNVIRVTRETSGGFAAAHPARFPVRLAAELVEPFTSYGEAVLDPFMGSGTTGVACVQLGRKFIGIELEPRYFEIACRRISDELRRPRLQLDPVAKPVQEALSL